MDRWLYYKRVAGRAPEPADLEEGYQAVLWRPTWTRLVPRGMPFHPFLIWWILHQLRVFPNRDYAIVLIRHQNQLVHRSVVTPAYFRFPFMRDSELQVGDTWTHEAHRGKGLATLGLQAALAGSPNREFWYLVETGNLPSIRVAEKLGFCLVGTGTRTLRLGLALFGSFVLRELAPGTTPEHPR